MRRCRQNVMPSRSGPPIFRAEGLSMRIFSIAFATLFIAASAVAPSLAATPAPYTVADHFRAVWSADACVQQRGQTWDDYVGWLQQFFSGPDGWNALSSEIARKVTNSAARTRLTSELQVLGIRVAGEWAKDNSCRKIRTTTGFFNGGEAGKPALSTWRAQLEGAMQSDSGDGSTIQAAVTQIRREVDAVLKPQQ